MGNKTTLLELLDEIAPSREEAKEKLKICYLVKDTKGNFLLATTKTVNELESVVSVDKLTPFELPRFLIYHECNNDWCLEGNIKLWFTLESKKEKVIVKSRLSREIQGKTIYFYNGEIIKKQEVIGC